MSLRSPVVNTGIGDGPQHRKCGFDSRPDFQMLSVVELVKTQECDS